MPRKKQTIEERRALQRLCKRRRYEKIKNDPELLALAQEQRRIRYLKDKATRKVKSISEKPLRIQREQRKKWKENSKRYRQNKKQAKPPKLEVVSSNEGESSQREKRKKWREYSKRHRQNKKQAKHPYFEDVAVFIDECDSNSTHELEDPLQVLQQNNYDAAAAIRKIRYEEFKKRKKLRNIIAAYKERDRARFTKIQRLKKIINELKTQMEPKDDMPVPENNCSEISQQSENSPIVKIEKFEIFEIII